MATRGQQAGIAGAVVGAAAAAVLGVAKAVAITDRRRAGTTAQQARLAGGLADPSDARQSTLTLSDGASIHVVERGLLPSSSQPTSLPPILLLHGVTLSTRIWHHVLDDLGDVTRVVAVDWRGHGKSVAGSDGFGLTILARDLAEILTQLDLHGAIVVGHSMGGMALMRFCADHPSVLSERVDGLMFLSTAAANVGTALVPAALKDSVRKLLSRRSVAERASWILPGDLGYSMVRTTFGEHPPPAAVELARDIVAGMDSDATAASFVPLLAHDATATLPRLRVPVTVVVGSHDRLTPPSQAHRLASLIPKSVVVELDGPGHMIMLERPAELHRLIRDLAERCASVSVHGRG
jgi:pimeloyl-ACP methyl ester carboxylesterase